MKQEQSDPHRHAGPGPRWGSEAALVVALAAVGGLSSVGLSWGGPGLCKLVALPGGMQWLSGIHVLPLILAAGLVRWPGTATIAGALKGAVEWLAGSSHGLLVLVYAILAGAVIDIVFALLRRRDAVGPNLLAGGLATASNVFVLVCMTGRPGYCQMTTSFPSVLAIALTSGVVLAGWPGWMLARALRGIRAHGTRALVSGDL